MYGLYKSAAIFIDAVFNEDNKIYCCIVLRCVRGLGFGVWGLGFGVWEIGRAHV